MTRAGIRFAACLALVLVAIGGTTLVGTGAAESTTYSPQVGLTASQCTSDGAQGCKAQIPCSSSPCPAVDVSPNVDLQDGQSVSINVTNFPPTDSFRVALCSGITSSTDPSCLDGTWETSQYNPISVPVTDDPTNQNLTSVTYPVFLDPSGEANTVLPALDMLDLNNNTPGFYCDNAVDPCDLVVTDESGQGPVVGLGPPVSTTNSVVIPLTFRAQTSGCPTGIPNLNTAGSTSVEQFLPAAVEATCRGAAGVVALNTTFDTQSVVSDVAAGGAAVGFIDNPEDPTQLAALKGKSYALVPVAVSASTVAFLAGFILNNVAIPISTYNLTPNMVAGLISSEYESPSGSPSFQNGGFEFADADNLVSALAAANPAVTCTQLYLCPTSPFSQLFYESNLDAFDLFNPLSAAEVLDGGLSPQTFGSFMPDVPSGASYQASDWLCHAPNPSLTATVFENDANFNPVATAVKVHDPNLAATTLTVAPTSSVWPPSGDPGAKWVFPSCQGISDFPSIAGGSGFYSSAQSPALQASKMRTFAYGGGELPQPQNSSDPLAAFGIMDSSEAAFYGLNTASLENASGRFVAPTKASVEAGLNSAQLCAGQAVSATCPADTYQFNYSNPDPTAYAMPDITYAVVPTSGQSAATTTAIRSLVTNLVDYSTSGALPSGYYPMPAAMAKAALADLNTALPPAAHGSSGGSTQGCTHAGSCPSSPPSTVPPASSTLPATPVAGAGVTPGLTGPSGGVVGPGIIADRAARSGVSNPTGKQGTPAVSHPPVIPVDLSLISLSTLSRLILPISLILAVLCLVSGYLILRREGVARVVETAGDDS